MLHHCFVLINATSTPESLQITLKKRKKKKKTKKKKALVQYSFTIELKEKIEAHLLEGAQKTRQQN